jgi:transcriptional regulator with XRE-family HTH domain
MTAQQLAERVGVTPVTVWSWEKRGRTPRPTALKSVAAVLGVDVSELGCNGRTAARRSHIDSASLEELMRAIEAKGFSVEVKSTGK